MREKFRNFVTHVPWLRDVARSAYRQRTRLKRLIKPYWLYRLTRTKWPLSDVYGFDRGTPIDRYYIEEFLQKYRRFITGWCLEILNANYTHTFGQEVTTADILDIDRTNQRATIHDDLRNLTKVADASYDCVILTQVLQFIDRPADALRETYRILKPGGTLLATVPAISRVDVRSGVDGDFWRFTAAGTRYLFQSIFDASRTTIEVYGNCPVGLGFWAGASVQEFSRRQLDYQDPNFPCVICIRATKA